MGTIKRFASVIAIGLASLVALNGCGNKNTVTEKVTTVEKSTVMDAKDFDLETVIGLVTGESGVKDMKELESKINGDSGINNVDIDKDGKIDYVSAAEKLENGKQVIDFRAHPSAKPDDEPVVIASIDISKNETTQQVEVSGGYPQYVGGYGDHYYHHTHHGLTFGQAMFLSYMFMPRPLYVPMAPMAMGYVPRAVMPASQVQSTRSSFRTTTRMAPVTKQAAPKNYSISSAQKSAAKVQSTYAKPTATGLLKGNAAQQRQYTDRGNKAQGPSSNLRSTPRASTPLTPRANSPTRSYNAPAKSYSPPVRSHSPARPSIRGRGR